MGLIDPQIKEAYEKEATHNSSPSKKDIWFDFYSGMDCGLGKAGDYICAVRDRSGEHPVQSSIHRAAFLNELVALVPRENVSFGKRVVEVVETASGVRLRFEDGGQAEASAAIGCDGVKSKIRHFVLGDDDFAVHPSFTKKYAYRGLIHMPKAVELLGDELARNAVMYCGLHGHILTFPIEKGERVNVVAFRTKRDGKWDDERWVLPMERAEMDEDFEAWGEIVKKLLSLMESPDVWALFDYPPAKCYNKGRICLSGDGAHASTPHQGAGAGMALEDAYIMSSLLGLIEKGEDIEQAFKAFDAVRRPRTQKLVTSSREAGELYDCEVEGTLDDKEALKRNLSGRYKWIWEKRLEEDLEEAMGVLR